MHIVIHLLGLRVYESWMICVFQLEGHTAAVKYEYDASTVSAVRCAVFGVIYTEPCSFIRNSRVFYTANVYICPVYCIICANCSIYHIYSN